MSERIKHIIDVIQYVKSNYKGYDITKIRRDADKFVASKYGIKERSVVDKYRRQLKDRYGNDLGTQNFDHLLEKWLNENDKELKNISMKYCIDGNDKQLVINFFSIDRSGLIDWPFFTNNPDESMHKINVQRSFDEELLELVIDEVAPSGPKIFPENFLSDKQTNDFFYVELPGTILYLDPLFQTIIASPKGYFKYQAKNPAEARYILYSNKIGLKKVAIPNNNFIVFKAVKDYEKYCRELKDKAFEHFVEFIHDEDHAELLTQKVIRKLELKAIYK